MVLFRAFCSRVDVDILTAVSTTFEPNLVLYAYTQGSEFDDILVEYMVQPRGIDPSLLNGGPRTSTNGNDTISVSVPLGTARRSQNTE